MDLPDHHRYIDRLEPTPLVAVALKESDPLIWCKLEFLNPTRSIKDRIARYILEKAFREGKIKKGSWVAEASSGSTSIALALACAQMELQFLAVVPEGSGHEKELMMRAFGAEIIFSPAAEGMKGALALVEKEAKKRNAFLTKQFENPNNAQAHYLTTAQEILAQIPNGNIDAVVAGVGTGGTIAGLTRAFKEVGCKSTPYIPIPTSTTLVGGVECCSFSQSIPGIVDSISKLYDKQKMPDAVEFQVKDTVAIQTTRDLMKLGFPVGPSSGLNYAAALMVAKKLDKDAQIVTVFPDGMEKYFSSQLFKPFEQ